MPAGNRIYTRRKLVDKAIIEAFASIPCGNVADCLGRSAAMNPRIRLISKPKKEINAGSALTIKARAGDNLMLHAAMGMAEEGDFIVLSNEGDTTRAITGEVMLTYLRYYKKVAGVIIDGPIRDTGEISEWDFPVYATGSTPGGPYKEGPGEVNVPIACGNVSVNPGDLILADADGVVVIPRADAADILPIAEKYKLADSAKIPASRDGSIDRSWVDKALKAKGVEIIDSVYPD